MYVFVESRAERDLADAWTVGCRRETWNQLQSMRLAVKHLPGDVAPSILAQFGKHGMAKPPQHFPLLASISATRFFQPLDQRLHIGGKRAFQRIGLVEQKVRRANNDR